MRLCIGVHAARLLSNSLNQMNKNFHTEITIGQRLNLASILENQQGDFAVVVSGPASMMDEVRERISKLACSKHVKLIAESYTW